MEKKLFFVDREENVGGVEDFLSYPWFSTTWVGALTRHIDGSRDIRLVTEDLIRLSQKYQTWNPPFPTWGTSTNSVIGCLDLLSSLMRVSLPINKGEMVVQDKEGREIAYLLRPCRAELMAKFLWRRYEKNRKRRIAEMPEPVPWDLTFPIVREAMRLCFSLRKITPPKKVFFSKGTCYVTPPHGAVARIGGGRNSVNVFLDRFARPIAAYRARQNGPRTWAEEVPIPKRLEWWNIYPLSQGITDILFGVRGEV